MRINLFLLVLLSTLFFKVDTQRKIINTPHYNYEFYVLVNNVGASIDSDKMIYWYRSREIHNSIGASGGNLLHGQYQKSYKSSQLAEKGEFEFGLKKGEWNTWYESGLLKEVIDYKDGARHGLYTSFDSNGNMLDRGVYRKGKKKGKWIENALDTLKYRKGIIKAPRDTSNTIVKKLKKFFKKKEKDSLKSPKKLKTKIKKNDAGKKSFFRKILDLFKKKEIDPLEKSKRQKKSASKRSNI